MQYSRYVNPKLSGVIVKEAVKCGNAKVVEILFSYVSAIASLNN